MKRKKEEKFQTMPDNIRKEQDASTDDECDKVKEDPIEDHNDAEVTDSIEVKRESRNESNSADDNNDKNKKDNKEDVEIVDSIKEKSGSGKQNTNVDDGNHRNKKDNEQSDDKKEKECAENMNKKDVKDKDSSSSDTDNNDDDKIKGKEQSTNDGSTKDETTIRTTKSVDDVRSKVEINKNTTTVSLSEPRPTEETKKIKDCDTLMADQKSELVAAAEADARKNKDQPAPSETAVRPNNHDVLFGRGKPFQNHPGNRKMLGLIDRFKRQYNESPRDQKRPIVEEIIGILSSDGGRFLRRYNDDVSSTWWTVVSQQIAFDKVSHAFRSRGRTKAAQSVIAMNKVSYDEQQSIVTPHPHHSQHLYQTHHPQYQHHEGQYSLEGLRGSHQYVQGTGMPIPGHYPSMMAATAASMQQQPHSAMMGYHPMPPGVSPQQQAMMQAGMMAMMQQQQQQHGAVLPPGHLSTYGQAQYPPQSPYQQQHAAAQFGSSINPYYGRQQTYQHNNAQANGLGGYQTQSVFTPTDYEGYGQPPSFLKGLPAARMTSASTSAAATEEREGTPILSEGIGPSPVTIKPTEKNAGEKAEDTEPISGNESK